MTKYFEMILVLDLYYNGQGFLFSQEI